MSLSDRSLDQRLAALARANEIRFRRADLKRDLRAGRLTPAEVLGSTEDWLATMKVADVLLACPKLGRVKVAKALNRCSVSPSKSIGGITHTQRARLLKFLARHHPHVDLFGGAA